MQGRNCLASTQSLICLNISKMLETQTSCNHRKKTDLAKGLYRIFVSDTVVDTHWAITDSPNLWWHRNDGEIGIIREFICKQSILENLGIKDQDWLRQVQRDRDPNRALLRPIMEKVAWRWLRDTERSVDRPFTWIREHLTMVSFLHAFFLRPDSLYLDYSYDFYLRILIYYPKKRGTVMPLSGRLRMQQIGVNTRWELRKMTSSCSDASVKRSESTTGLGMQLKPSKMLSTSKTPIKSFCKTWPDITPKSNSIPQLVRR